MGHSLYVKELEHYLSINPLSVKEFPIFIETGTWQGRTVANMLGAPFTELYSIELAPNYFEQAKQRLKDHFDKVRLYHGDSTDVLPTILPKITKPTVFYLDGHWSGGASARGAKDCPLLEEIAAIEELFLPPAIVIIDDLGLFETNPNEDWSEISVPNILGIISSRVVGTREIDDRLILFIEEK